MKDRIKGALLGTAIGDALGMPVEGLSHPNVRTYYKGIKSYRSDEQRHDLAAGQWTDDTQFTFALANAMSAAPNAGVETLADHITEGYVGLQPVARRWGPTSRAAIDRLAEGVSWRESGDAALPTNGAAMRAAPFGCWLAATGAAREEAFAFMLPLLQITHRHSASVVAGFGQAFAVRAALCTQIDHFDRGAFWRDLREAVAWTEEQLGSGDRRVSDRLQRLEGHLRDVPLDLQELCDGTGAYADESWPFAVAMFARNPVLIEATLLSAINVGGDADTVGAMTGALLGALHGWSAFPPEWREGLDDAARLEREADTFARSLSSDG